MVRIPFGFTLARLAALLVTLTAASLNAVTIVATSGPDGGCLFANSGQALRVSWTSLQAYSNVSISVRLRTSSPSGAPPPQTSIAYLTSASGPGTTVAKQIATAVVTATSEAYQAYSLFTGLTLPAGTYYLVLASGSLSSAP